MGTGKHYRPHAGGPVRAVPRQRDGGGLVRRATLGRRGSAPDQRPERRRAQDHALPLRACRKRFSVRTGTTMEASNLGYQTWAIAIYLLTTSLKGVSSLHRDLGIRQASAWQPARRGPLRTRPGGPMRRTCGRELEQACRRGPSVGSPRPSWLGSRTGPPTASAPPSCASNAQAIRGQRMQPGAALHRHGGVPRPSHHTAAHHRRVCPRPAHTNGLESFWALMKRGYGTYHHMSRRHLGRYVDQRTAQRAGT